MSVCGFAPFGYASRPHTLKMLFFNNFRIDMKFVRPHLLTPAPIMVGQLPAAAWGTHTRKVALAVSIFPQAGSIKGRRSMADETACWKDRWDQATLPRGNILLPRPKSKLPIGNFLEMAAIRANRINGISPVRIDTRQDQFLAIRGPDRV